MNRKLNLLLGAAGGSILLVINSVCLRYYVVYNTLNFFLASLMKAFSMLGLLAVEVMGALLIYECVKTYLEENRNNKHMD